MIKYSNNLIDNFPDYLFNKINQQKLALRQSGEDVIDLGYGNPDIPSHELVVEKLIESAQIKKNHKYSVSKGIHGLRNAIANKYLREYKINLDPSKNIVNTIGSKEGLTHLLMSILNKGDNVVVQDPSYPIHHYAPLIAGANVIKIECLNSENFLNNLDTTLNSQKIKAVLVSFPHNPTTLTVNQEFYDELVGLARRHNFLIINDFAYSDVYFNDEKPPSLLNSDPKFDHTVELYSLTKGYSMAGWRVGFAVGNESAISSLTKLKSYIDYGTFQPIQIASTVAINELDDYPKEVSSIYQDRKILAEEYLTKYGFEVYKSTATMFLWAKLPEVYKNDSMKFSIDLLSISNVAVSPGVGFGNCGEGHIRLALVENKQRTRQAMKNFSKIIDSV